MDDRKYNLLYVLNRLVNSGDSSVNTVLAKYFINHFYQAKNFNIYDIAEECDVSRSSIRRFAKDIGYNNFQSLKKLMIEESARPTNLTDNKYREMLTNTLSSIINELDERMDTDQVGVICDWIRESKQFYIACSGNTLSAVKDFQVKLADKGKLSQIIYDEKDIHYLDENANVGDRILVISISGIAAKRFISLFKNKTIDRTLVTANRIDDFTSDFNPVYYMSHLDHSKNPNLYRKYGLNYFLDIIANHY